MKSRPQSESSDAGGTPHYKTSVTVDVVLMTIDRGILKVLTVKRSNEPFADSPALPGGFLRAGETSYAAAGRILRDKAGVKNVYMEQLFTFDDADRDPRGGIITIAHYAIVPYGKINILKSADTETPEFVPVSDLPKLAFDHNKIIDYALGRLRAKIEYTNLSYSLLPEKFTLTELQNTYEVILARKLDKRNFRKKFLQLDLVEETGESAQGGRQRPAKQYRFKNLQLTELKKFF